MNTSALTVENALTLKRADQLTVGDIIPGGNAAIGHKVEHVTLGTIDDMLGLVVKVVVRNQGNAPDQGQYYTSRDYTFRPSDRLWVERR